VLKASTGSNRAAIRRHHAEAVGGDSLASVVIASSADPAPLVAKAVVAALTGSVALVAETLHSFADTGNQLLLLKGYAAPAGPTRGTRFGCGAELF
jgi:divalent metal cation (Fe/Co/Zn/Cd) transporter